MFSAATLGQLGPFISGIGLLAGALAAWCTLFLYHRKNIQMQWSESFRQIYSDFWENEKVSEARRWIDNDIEYENLKIVLQTALKNDGFDLTVSDYDSIESLDFFLATMLRAASFMERNKKKMSRDQQWLWNNMFQRYWVPKMYSRTEVKDYITTYWKGLYSLTYEEPAALEAKSRAIPAGDAITPPTRKGYFRRIKPAST